MEGLLRRPVIFILAATGTVAYAWWTTGLRPFTWQALVAVEAAGIMAMVLGSTRRRAVGSSGYDPRSAWVLVLALTLLAAWELAAYVQHPRHEHPTLSSIADQMLDWHPVRALAFLVWLALGADLARR